MAKFSLKTWLSRIMYSIGLDIILLAIFGTGLVILTIIYKGKFTFLQSSFILPSIVLLIMVIIVFLVNIKKIFGPGVDAKKRINILKQISTILRDWSPLIIMIFIYENFHELTYLINPVTVDSTLRAIDEAIFGIEPTIAFQKITFPLLTEYMTFCYALYFVYATVILTMLYSMKEFIKFKEVSIALSLCFYLGLLGYMFVPAIGPRYYITDEFTVSLVGPFLTGPAANAWNNLQKVQRDCFPSLHTALTTVPLIYFWRLRNTLKCGKLIFGISLPLIVSLWFSTVYLRYHWTIDVFAGWILAYLCCLIAPIIIKTYYKMKSNL